MRRIFNVICVLCTLLCILCLAVWTWGQRRSYLRIDGTFFRGGTAVLLNDRGLYIVHTDSWPRSTSTTIVSDEPLDVGIGYDQHFPVPRWGLGDSEFARGPMVTYSTTFRNNYFGPRPPRGFKGGMGVLSAGNGWSLKISFSQVMGVTALPPGIWLILKARQFRGSRIMQRRGLCPSCGYDLRASPERCPECGAAAPKPSESTLAP